MNAVADSDEEREVLTPGRKNLDENQNYKLETLVSAWQKKAYQNRDPEESWQAQMSQEICRKLV